MRIIKKQQQQIFNVFILVNYLFCSFYALKVIYWVRSEKICTWKDKDGCASTASEPVLKISIKTCS